MLLIGEESCRLVLDEVIDRSNDNYQSDRNDLNLNKIIRRARKKKSQKQDSWINLECLRKYVSDDDE